MLEVIFQKSAEQSLIAAAEQHMFPNCKVEDIICLPLYLQYGELNDDAFGKLRREQLENLFAPYPDAARRAEERLSTAKNKFVDAEDRIMRGEPVRIWAANSPSAANGLRWFLHRVNRLPIHGPVSWVQLPGRTYTADGRLAIWQDYSDLRPEDWEVAGAWERLLRPAMIEELAGEWDRMIEENSPLRAVISDDLRSVTGGFYDFLVWRAISESEGTFTEREIIDKVLQDVRGYLEQLWLAHRIDRMREIGWLEVVEEAPAGQLRYERRLQKSPQFHEGMVEMMKVLGPTTDEYYASRKKRMEAQA